MKIQAITYPIGNFFRLNHKPQRYLFNQGFDTFTFSGKRRTKEEIEQEKQKIKEILLSAKKENKKLSLPQISESLNGTPPSIVEYRIRTDEELKSLWDNTKLHQKITFSQEEKEVLSKAVGESLYGAYKNSQKITIADLIEKIGISKSTLKQIIESNSKYCDLCSIVRKYEPTNNKIHHDVDYEIKLIEQALTNAVSSESKTAIGELSQETGIASGIIYQRIKNNPHLQELYKPVKYKHHTKQEMNQIRSKLIDYLNIKIQNGESVTLAELIRYCEIEKKTLYKIIRNDEEIKRLWEQTNHKNRVIQSKLEVEKTDNHIHKFLTQKREQNQTVTIDEIAQHFNLSRNIIIYRISINSSLRYQWNKVKFGKNAKYESWETDSQTKNIVKILENYQSKGMKITIAELANMTGLSKFTVQARINDCPKANRIYSAIRKQQHTTYSQKEINKQYEKIEKLLSDALAKNEKITLKQIAQELKVDISLVSRKIKSSKKLSVMWKQLHEKQGN